MNVVKSFAAYDEKSDLRFYPLTRRSLKDDDVEIDIEFCGVCHSDLHSVKDEWGKATFPLVPGHEIVGRVARIGSKVRKFKVGDTVGVGCMVDSCQNCSSCHEGLEQYCENGFKSTYGSTDKYGELTQGGYSTKIVVNENFVLNIPENLPLDAAAPLLCAGITTYSPLKHFKAGPDKKIAVVGLGGLGHMAVKIAKAMGAEVTVLSHSDKKREDAKRLGADHYHNTQDSKTFTELANSFDIIINTVSAKVDLNSYLTLVKRDGALVLLGIPPEAPEIAAQNLIFKRRTLAGSLIGGIKETQEMLNFCGQHNIVSDIERIKISQINDAYERMLAGDVKFRFVIDSASFAEF